MVRTLGPINARRIDAAFARLDIMDVVSVPIALARDVFRTHWLERRGVPPPSGVPQRMRGAEILAGLDAGSLAIFEPESRALRVLKSAKYLRDALATLENGGTASREGLAEGEWAEFLLMVDDIAFMNGMEA